MSNIFGTDANAFNVLPNSLSPSSAIFAPVNVLSTCSPLSKKYAAGFVAMPIPA